MRRFNSRWEAAEEDGHHETIGAVKAYDLADQEHNITIEFDSEGYPEWIEFNGFLIEEKDLVEQLGKGQEYVDELISRRISGFTLTCRHG